MNLLFIWWILWLDDDIGGAWLVYEIAVYLLRCYEAQLPFSFTSTGANWLWFGNTRRTVGGHGEIICKDFEIRSIRLGEIASIYTSGKLHDPLMWWVYPASNGDIMSTYSQTSIHFSDTPYIVTSELEGPSIISLVTATKPRTSRSALLIRNRNMVW